MMRNEANTPDDFNSVRGARAFNFPPPNPSIKNTTWLTELSGMGWCLFARPPPGFWPLYVFFHTAGAPLWRNYIGRMARVNRTWTTLEELHTSLLLEALLRLTRSKRCCRLQTHRHLPGHSGSVAVCASNRLTVNKKREREKKSSPFIFLECQKGAKGWIVFLQLGTVEQNI